MFFVIDWRWDKMKLEKPALLINAFMPLTAAALILMTVSIPVHAILGAGLNEIYPPLPQYVDIKNNTFNPDNITILLNTTLTWSNHDETAETVTATDGSFDSGNITPGGYQYRYIFLQPGWYDYYSRDHPSIRGTVIVETENGSMPPRPQHAPAQAPSPKVPEMNVSTNATKPAASAMNMSANETKPAVSITNISANATKPAISALNISANATKSAISTANISANKTKPAVSIMNVSANTAETAVSTMNMSMNATKPVASSLTAGNTSANAKAKSVSFGLIAKNIAFNTSTIMVPAGANVTINFDNQDQGIPHNFAVFETSAAQNVIFRGQIITGPKKTTYTFTAPLKPGAYFFHCDVHPTQMYGQFIVESSDYSGPFTK
jgi:plastocyanin